MFKPNLISKILTFVGVRKLNDQATIDNPNSFYYEIQGPKVNDVRQWAANNGYISDVANATVNATEIVTGTPDDTNAKRTSEKRTLETQETQSPTKKNTNKRNTSLIKSRT